ncbi:GNAT family N-acetyltransferase [Nocardioides acrostichi]|uniref:GNAT family N-acetyltransferase n=1 Tax=Nocardioides acrostichi TaxID=2784339 RepID=A0A930Y4L7_9ACTN|nr:GNAT family N-acetyltransferase [Nocardioides acrostichi]MBF4160325.1 GNAT family N-acetyltransferase [Nocardioides acrostichi]
MSGSQAVRRAGPGDDAALAALRRTWVEEIRHQPVDDPTFPERFAAWLEAERHQRLTWVVEHAGEVVGMLNVLVFTRMPKPGAPTSRWGYLANFYVLSDHRNGGLGALMLTQALAECDAEGFVRVVLSPSSRSRSLYTRAGFGPADGLLVRPGGKTEELA